MSHRLSIGFVSMVISLLGAPGAAAVEVKDLSGFEDLFGRYAPAGDCSQQPQVVVERSGLIFEVAGQRVVPTNPEYAPGYHGHDYEGIVKVFFPFRRPDGEYPIVLQFNDRERPGALAIEGHGEGWIGGPDLSPRNQALVDGSPYARCP